MPWGRRISTTSIIRPITRQGLLELKKCYVDMSKTEQLNELTLKIYNNTIEQAKTTDYKRYEFKPSSSHPPFNAYFVKNNKDEIVRNLSTVFPDSEITVEKISTDIPFAYFPTHESILIDWS